MFWYLNEENYNFTGWDLFKLLILLHNEILKFRQISKPETGDQPAINELIEWEVKVTKNFKHCWALRDLVKLLPLANVIQQVQRPTSLFWRILNFSLLNYIQNFKHLFPENAKLNILSHIMIIINPRHIFLLRRHILKKIYQLMKKLENLD